jgi:hypothetical protein
MKKGANYIINCKDRQVFPVGQLGSTPVALLPQAPQEEERAETMLPDITTDSLRPFQIADISSSSSSFPAAAAAAASSSSSAAAIQRTEEAAKESGKRIQNSRIRVFKRLTKKPYEKEPLRRLRRYEPPMEPPMESSTAPPAAPIVPPAAQTGRAATDAIIVDEDPKTDVIILDD